MKIRLFLTLVTLLSISSVSATTWDEPWADSVIKNASSFVLAKIASADSKKGIRIFIIKTLGGQQLQDSIAITNFYLLDLCSRSADGVEFQTRQTDSCYFFLKQVNGKYTIATPSTGYDYAADGNVIATYRHSYHQARVPVALYEKTMTAIFNGYHDLPYDHAYILDFVQSTLKQKPAGVTEAEIDRFFSQHVALECIYHLKLKVDDALLLPYLHDHKNFHAQISGARALSVSNDAAARDNLLHMVADTATENFVKVICVKALQNKSLQEVKGALQQLQQKASDESNEFGGNIMDPRVCTHLPSVKAALQQLITKL